MISFIFISVVSASLGYASVVCGGAVEHVGWLVGTCVFIGMYIIKIIFSNDNNDGSGGISGFDFSDLSDFSD